MMTDTNESERNTPSQPARTLFASGLTTLAIHNLTGLDDRIVCAEMRGAPEADRLAPVATGLLLGGSLGVGFWKPPRLASVSITTFFTGITLAMHDSWVVDDDTRDGEFTSFLQSLTLFGATLAFFRYASDK